MQDDSESEVVESKKSLAIKPPRFRSPPYPSMSLEKAVERASSLYEKSLHHSVPASVPAEAWGYGQKSGSLFAALAALKQYGLIRDEGSGDKRRFKLTDIAIRVVRDTDPASEKRRNALRTAAFNPTIFRELWDKYGVPGASGAMASVLKTYLTLDRADEGASPYSDNAADELLSVYQASLQYAGVLNEDDGEPEEEQEEDDSSFDQEAPRPSKATAEMLRPPQKKPTQHPDLDVNDVRFEIAEGKVRISAYLDRDGVDTLSAKLSALKELLQ